MRLKLRVGDGKQMSRSEIDLVVREVRVQPNRLDDSDAKLEVCFREGDASGIIEMTREEAKALCAKLKNVDKKDDFLDEG
jgi:hypothetical protein